MAYEGGRYREEMGKDESLGLKKDDKKIRRVENKGNQGSKNI